MENKLHINKVEGEKPPARRRRIATAITKLLSDDDLLRREVANQLLMHEKHLVYTQRRDNFLDEGLNQEPDSNFEEC